MKMSKMEEVERFIKSKPPKLSHNEYYSNLKEQSFSWDPERYEIVLLRQGQLVLKEKE